MPKRMAKTMMGRMSPRAIDSRGFVGMMSRNTSRRAGVAWTGTSTAAPPVAWKPQPGRMRVARVKPMATAIAEVNR